MSIADIVIISIVGLFALVGIAKGFFKSLISLFGWFISMLVAVLAARAVAEALLDVPAIADFVVGKSGFSLFSWLSGLMPEGLMQLPAGASEAEIMAAMGGGVAGAILTPFLGLLTGESIALSTATVGQGMALTLAGGVFMVLVGAALFIVCRIVMQLFIMFFRSLVGNAHTGVLSRFMGFLLGGVRGALYCCVLLVIVGFLTPFGFMQPVTQEIDAGVIAKPVAEQVYRFSSRFTANDNYFNKLLELSGMKGNEPGGDENYVMTGEETELYNFAIDAFVNEGGIFNAKLISEERPQFNEWSNKLIAYMRASGEKVASGAFKGNPADVTALLPYTKATSTPEGTLYRAFCNLSVDLSNYFAMDASLTEVLAEKEQRIRVDFANVVKLIEDTGYKVMFGDISFDGLTAAADLDTLYPNVEIID